MTPKRLLATLAALVVIATHVAGLGHYVLVAHYFCAEHGTLHEGSPELSVGSDSDDSRQTASVETGDEHGHDECSYFSRGTGAAVDTTPATAILLTDEASANLVFGSRDAVVTLTTLDFAPKQSPPSAS